MVKRGNYTSGIPISLNTDDTTLGCRDAAGSTIIYISAYIIHCTLHKAVGSTWILQDDTCIAGVLLLGTGFTSDPNPNSSSFFIEASNVSSTAPRSGSTTYSVAGGRVYYPVAYSASSVVRGREFCTAAYSTCSVARGRTSAVYCRERVCCEI